MTSTGDTGRPTTRDLVVAEMATIVAAVTATVITAIVLAAVLELDVQPLQPTLVAFLTTSVLVLMTLHLVAGPIAILLPLRLAPAPDRG